MSDLLILTAGILAILLLGGVVATLGLWLVLRLRRDRRRKRRQPPRDSRPIGDVVLVHGLMGFDELRIGLVRCAYFRGVARGLMRMGVNVHTPSLPAFGSIRQRARCLADFVSELPSRRINIIAHSMGGLDARFAISQLGLARTVNALVTIGTPHHGTPLADLGADMLLGKLGLGRVLAICGVDVAAFYDLTVARMERFNRAVIDHPQVTYSSVVGTSRGALFVNHLLIPAFLWLRRRQGDNDGLVSGQSQGWGEVLAEVEADHMAQIGWSLGFDALAIYEHIVSELRGRGC